ncbi:DUF1254 domain-containing protein [Leucobacter aridicollis]|uniref:DUF1254 domain-containing protein n=1 Tax=Leucobacter aridicollis TaxID=283878 RepID=UPI0021061868|nr:DUF1254 domain-containing protein [Leucobacter aridicollis]UTX52011.1 DUF1254 domain-containing protein [Leucobacter aridicollis]
MLNEMTSAEISARATDAVRFGYAMVESYRTMYAQAIDATDPRFLGGFGVYRHYREPSTPESRDVITPNNDTPYSWIWLDLRAEPVVVTVPEIDRYYIIPIADLYTIYSGYIGTRLTGSGAGSYLVAGPNWRGEVPAGISGVIRVTTDFAMSATRTELTNDGIDSLAAVQSSYEVQPLSAFLGEPAPPAAQQLEWPVWDEEGAAGLWFFDTLDFLLGLSPVLPEDAEIRARMAEIGLDGTGTFAAKQLTAEAAAAFTAGQAQALAEMSAREKTMQSNLGLFGTREEMSGKYDDRNQGAKIGLYGLPPEESWYGGWLVEPTGEFLQGSPGYTVRFDADELPKARFFWSATMYTLPIRYLSQNPISRYSIGDRTDGLVYGEDGSLTLAFTHSEPIDPALRANWLPAPEGPFTVILRAYGADETMVRGEYRVPPVVKYAG